MTTSRSKAKGTSGEREVKKALGWPELRRTAASCAWDLEILGESPVEVLATRPDNGRWLVTMTLGDFGALWDCYNKSKPTPGLRVECKRHRAFAVHSIYEDTYPRLRQRVVRADGLTPTD